ncbi:MAG: class 1 fructose-bisphosphatase [Myxococcota bacterium]|nr:class 1 fructose-bisphosphatase [Myxococcota bacterium]
MPDSGWKDFHTLESYIAAEEKMHPQSRGLFSHLLRRVGLASKVINSKVLRAGLNDVLGDHGATNVQGESQMKLDVIANDIMKATFRWMPIVIGMASEEEDELISLPRPNTGMPAEDHYIIMFDPLDGSSNIDANVSVGTIFSIHRALSDTEKKETVAAGLPDFLQPGYKQEASGYVIYGSSTMFVYTTGHGVHGFTLDPEIGEYILSHENIRIPNTCKCFSANEGNYNKWDTATKQYADYLRSGKDERYKKTTSRYIGSLVADFHRNLLYGGIFLYPADAKTGKGKLRLLYEGAPLAMLVEQAGGLATTGQKRILDVQPTELHQRVPLIIGNKHEVELYEKMVREHTAN